MTVDNAMKAIESHEFAAQANLAAALPTFISILDDSNAAGELMEAAKNSAGKSKISNRVCELARRKIDFRYENDWDVAIAAYIWLTHRVDQALANILIDAAEGAKNCWWTPRIIDAVIAAPAKSFPTSPWNLSLFAKNKKRVPQTSRNKRK